MLVQDPMERHASHVLPGAESVGIITIEDVIEELLQQACPARLIIPRSARLPYCKILHGCAMRREVRVLTCGFLPGFGLHPHRHLPWATVSCGIAT